MYGANFSFFFCQHLANHARATSVKDLRFKRLVVLECLTLGTKISGGMHDRRLKRHEEKEVSAWRAPFPEE